MAGARSAGVRPGAWSLRSLAVLLLVRSPASAPLNVPALLAADAVLSAGTRRASRSWPLLRRVASSTPYDDQRPRGMTMRPLAAGACDRRSESHRPSLGSKPDEHFRCSRRVAAKGAAAAGRSTAACVACRPSATAEADRVDVGGRLCLLARPLAQEAWVAPAEIPAPAAVLRHREINLRLAASSALTSACCS